MTKFECVMTSHVTVDVELPDGVRYDKEILEKAALEQFGKELEDALIKDVHLDYFSRVMEAKETKRPSKDSGELKPCPFCGSKRAKAWVDNSWRVFCPDCNCCTPWKSSRAEVIEMWNERSGAPAPACPFCGGGSRVQEVARKGDNRVICRICGCATSWNNRSINASQKVWNRRVSE